MATRNTITADGKQLDEILGKLTDSSDRVRVAGYGLAAPLLALREAQLTREVERMAARKGADHPEVASRREGLARMKARIALFHEELGRAQLDRAVLDSDTAAGIWGRVADKGLPVSDLTVIALTGQCRADFGCTDSRGAFALVVPSDTPVVLSVRARDGAELHRDREGTVLSAGQQQFREIDLVRGADMPCPEPEPSGGATEEKSFALVDLVDQREAAALGLIRAQGLKLGPRSETVAKDKAGLVLSQSPAAGTMVKFGDSVSIVVGASTQVKVPSVIRLTKDEAEKALGDASLVVGEITTIPARDNLSGLVVDQDPAPGIVLDRRSAVSLTMAGPSENGEPEGAAESRPQRDTESQPEDSGHKLVLRVAGLAEKRLREKGVLTDEPDGFLAGVLEKAGVVNSDDLDTVLAAERHHVRNLLEIKTLATTDKIRSALKRLRNEIID